MKRNIGRMCDFDVLEDEALFCVWRRDCILYSIMQPTNREPSFDFLDTRAQSISACRTRREHAIFVRPTVTVTQAHTHEQPPVHTVSVAVALCASATISRVVVGGEHAWHARVLTRFVCSLIVRYWLGAACSAFVYVCALIMHLYSIQHACLIRTRETRNMQAHIVVGSRTLMRFVTCLIVFFVLVLYLITLYCFFIDFYFTKYLCWVSFRRSPSSFECLSTNKGNFLPLYCFQYVNFNIFSRSWKLQIYPNEQKTTFIGDIALTRTLTPFAMLNFLQFNRLQMIENLLNENLLWMFLNY